MNRNNVYTNWNTEDELDDLVSQWHTMPMNEYKKLNKPKLHEFLGLTWEEYCNWSAEPGTIDRKIAEEYTGSMTDTVISPAAEDEAPEIDQKLTKATTLDGEETYVLVQDEKPYLVEIALYTQGSSQDGVERRLIDLIEENASSYDLDIDDVVVRVQATDG